EFYSGKPDPFPRLMGDILLEQYTASDRHHEKIGLKYEKDKNPYRTAKSTIKTLELSFFKKSLEELSEKYKTASEEEKKKIIQVQADVQSKIARRQKTDSDELYPDPDGTSENIVNEKVFEYKMKGEK
ncbi:MAG: DNA primase, partial [Balneolaceae bacterium]